MDESVPPASRTSIPSPLHPAHVREVKVIFETEVTDSFKGFTMNWRENRVFGFSPAAATKIRENYARFSPEDVVQFVNWVLLYININFVSFQVSYLLERGYADDEFFDVLLAVMDYLTDALTTTAEVLNVDTSAEEYQNAFGSVDLDAYLFRKSTEILLTHNQERIISTVCRRVRHLRTIHSYHSSFWSSISSASMTKVIELLKTVLVPVIHNNLITQYESELIHDITKYIKGIHISVSENRFLLMMKRCINVEQSNYCSIISRNGTHFSECKAQILDMFRDHHARKRNAHIFEGKDSDLVNPEVEFKPSYFRDLFTLYIFRGDKEVQAGIQKLTSLIYESFFQISEIHFKLLEEGVPGLQAIMSFKVGLEELSKQYILVRERLLQLGGNNIQNEVLMKTLDKACSYLSRSLGSNMGYIHQISAAENYGISFLCNCNLKSDDEIAFVSLIARYYFFISRRDRFMNVLNLRLRRAVLQRNRLPMDRLNTFFRWRYVEGTISKKVECLIQDLNTSIGMDEKDKTVLRDISSDLRCDTCLVTRSRYWGIDKDHSKLLRTLPQTERLQTCLTAHLSRSIDGGKRLIPMDCLSRVVVRTTLYSKGREFTRLNLLQHQSMILMLCKKEEPIWMSDIVKLISVEELETDERERAEKYVGNLVESLMHPYPLLLKTTQEVAGNAVDAVVTINHSFAFEDAEVRLPGDYLVLNEDMSL